MGFYNDNIIEEIKLKSDIVTVIGEFLPLKKRGRNFITNCPFHNEKTPSFTVSPDKQIYHCFGCNASGNVFTFLIEHEHMTFGEALKYLGDKAGVIISDNSFNDYGKPKNLEEDNRKERQFNIHQFVARYFYKKLHDEYGKEAFAYAKNRGLSQETLEKFKIGYAPFKSDELISQLAKLGYTPDELLESGIFSKSMEGKIYSKFFNRLIFPIENINNKIIGFGGRVIGNSEPKYLNSPETGIFKKKYNLYGLNLAKDDIRKKNQVLVMEGYMDVVSVWQKGVLNAVASLGTSFTEEQGRLLLRYTDEIVMVYDNDNAGKNAAIRAAGLLRPLNVSVKIADLNGAKDPDEFINRFGLNSFLERIRKAKSSFRYILDLNKGVFNYKEPEDKVKCARNVLPEIMSQQDPLLRNEYIKILCEELSISKEAIEAIIFKGDDKIIISNTKSNNIKEKEININDNYDKAQYNLLKIIINQLEYSEYLIKENFEEFFKNSLIKRTLFKILEIPLEFRTVKYMIDKIDDEKVKNLIVFLAMKEDLPKVEYADFISYLNYVKKIFYKNEIDRVIKLINIAEKEGNREFSVELQYEWNCLRLKLEDL
ncbi:MAG: DNA primase [Firmicutes bacterium]|nr:DNA primase [Bacillota bacterium]